MLKLYFCTVTLLKFLQFILKYLLESRETFFKMFYFIFWNEDLVQSPWALRALVLELQVKTNDETQVWWSDLMIPSSLRSHSDPHSLNVVLLKHDFNTNQYSAARDENNS